jgi:hypothetical protein
MPVHFSSPWQGCGLDCVGTAHALAIVNGAPLSTSRLSGPPPGTNNKGAQVQCLVRLTKRSTIPGSKAIPSGQTGATFRCRPRRHAMASTQFGWPSQLGSGLRPRGWDVDTQLGQVLGAAGSGLAVGWPWPLGPGLTLLLLQKRQNARAGSLGFSIGSRLPASDAASDLHAAKSLNPSGHDSIVARISSHR